jgi:RimJ/RimL family protein N-acetyltransferase
MDGASHLQQISVRSPHEQEGSVTLLLRPLCMDDLDDFYTLHADAKSWLHLPSGRHTDKQKTKEGLAGPIDDWKHGLSYWSVRSQEGELAGVGGARLIGDGSIWNLYYRVSPAWWGCGIAGKVAAKAVQLAHEVQPDVPVVAYLLEHNEASKRIAEKVLKLQLRWRGPDKGNEDPNATRLVYSDQPLDEAALQVVIS